MKNTIKNILVATLITIATSAMAQISTPLYVCNLSPVTDEFNRVMKGNATDSRANQNLVEIRVAPNGQIYSPDVDGSAHIANSLIATSGIGQNTSPKSQNTGLFCAVLVQRPATGTKLFARVYNAPTVEEASFYVDSAVVDSPVASQSMIEFVFGSAQPFDSADDDNDGLCNSLEKSLGSNPALADSNNDGISDLVSFLAGIDPTSATAGIYFDDVEFAIADGQVAFTWNSAESRRYQVVMTDSLTDTNFVNVGSEIIAEGSTSGIIVPVSELPYDGGFFQVRVIIDGTADIPAIQYCNLSAI